MALVLGNLAACTDSDPAAAPSTTTSSAPAVEAAAFRDASVERNDDGSLTIGWEIDDAYGPVEVRWSTDPEADGELLTTVEDTDTTTVDDPSPGRRPYFVLERGDATVRVAERRVVLEGAPNFRDLGGYETADGRRVRWGQLYRSGALADLTDADFETVGSLGIKLVCDLRSDGEVADAPDPDVGAESLRVAVVDEVVEIDTIRDAVLSGDLESIPDDLLLEGTASIALDFPDSWANMLERVMSEENRPTNVHCTSGKDRAGWASALMLRTLGVPEETVIEDYLLSNTYLADENATTFAQIRSIVSASRGVPEEEVDMTNLVALMEVRREYLQGAFDAVDAEFGSFDAYLTESLGFTSDQVSDFRDQLLE